MTPPRINEAKYFVTPHVPCSLTCIKNTIALFLSLYLSCHGYPNMNCLAQLVCYKPESAFLPPINYSAPEGSFPSHWDRERSTATWSTQNNDSTSRRQRTSIASTLSVPVRCHQCQTNSRTPRVSCLMFFKKKIFTIT